MYPSSTARSKSSWAGPENHGRPHRTVRFGILEAIPGGYRTGPLHRVENTTQGFGQGRQDRRLVGAPLDAIHRWNGEKSREPARDPGDSVFSIFLALVGIPREAIFAKRLPARAHALESLVYQD
mgnify:CR=1 FL=1